MSPRAAVALLAILIGAFVLRAQAVHLSVVDDPIRSDAREYVLYAHNLAAYGVYSRADTWAPGAPTPPEPDAVRPPGYPLFLLAFLGSPPRLDDLPAILWAQAALGTLTVLLAFLLGRSVLPTGLALVAAALTAASPHHVNMSIYVLSETLLALLLALALYLVCGLARHPTWPRAGLAGAALAASALTHPQLVYFALPLALFLLLRGRGRAALRTSVALAIGFGALYGAWSLRNALTPGVVGDAKLMLRTLRIGAYRDFMYRGRPETYGYPYRYDARFEESSASLGSVTREIARAIAEEPAAQLFWYLRKPLVAWTWEPVQGQGDVFVYPVSRTPYADLPHFRATHFVMHALHDALVALMILGVALAWLPPRVSRLGDDARFGARVLSLLFLYHAAVMAVGFPLPRYSIPLRPLLYILAMLPLAAGLWWLPAIWPGLSRPWASRERRMSASQRSPALARSSGLKEVGDGLHVERPEPELEMARGGHARRDGRLRPGGAAVRGARGCARWPDSCRRELLPQLRHDG